MYSSNYEEDVKPIETVDIYDRLEALLVDEGDRGNNKGWTFTAHRYMQAIVGNFQWTVCDGGRSGRCDKRKEIHTREDEHTQHNTH